MVVLKFETFEAQCMICGEDAGYEVFECELSQLQMCNDCFEDWRRDEIERRFATFKHQTLRSLTKDNPQ